MSEALIRVTRSVLSQARAIRSWLIWSLPRWLAIYVLAVIAADLAAIGIAAQAATFSVHNLTLFGLLLGCVAAAVEMTRKAGEQSGIMTDVQGVWALPLVILLPPFYALVIPIARVSLTHWRVRRGPVYRRIFTAAATGLSYGAASATFHGLSGLVSSDSGGTLSRGPVWVLLVIIAALVKWALNTALPIVAVKGSDRTADIRKAFFNRDST